MYYYSPGLEVIKLEFILRLKIKRNDWTLVHKQPIIALYFESETVLKFYSLEARSRGSDKNRGRSPRLKHLLDLANVNALKNNVWSQSLHKFDEIFTKIAKYI